MKKKLKSGDFGLLVVDCIVIIIALIPFILYHFNTYHLNSEGRIGLAIISCVVFGLSISGIIVCFNKNKSLANFRAGGFFAFSASLVLVIGNGTIYSLYKQPLNEKVITFLLAIPACAIALACFIYSFVLKTGNNKKDTIEVKENLDRYQNPAARAPKETNFIANDSEVERSSKEDSNDQPKDEKPVKIDKDNILEVCSQTKVKDDENSYENVCAILRSTAFIKLLELKSEYKNQLKEFENVKNIGEFLYVFKKFQRQ